MMNSSNYMNKKSVLNVFWQEKIGQKNVRNGVLNEYSLFTCELI